MLNRHLTKLTAMSYGIHTKHVHKKLNLDKWANSTNWYARLTLDNGKCIVRSIKSEDFEQAKELALELYYDTKARIEYKLPTRTRKVKHVAEFAVQRMQNEVNDRYRKQAYKGYISALIRWLITYFGGTDIDKIDLSALTVFDHWRTRNTKNNSHKAVSTIITQHLTECWMKQS